VHLATLGSPAAHTPRLTYARNLFHVGGIETREGPPAEVAPAVAVACICGADDDVRASGAAAAATLRSAGVRRILVAGRGILVDGVDEEVGVGSDVLDVLTRTLDHLLDHTEVAP
jgi:methylmalonyl-CoA mutase